MDVKAKLTLLGVLIGGLTGCERTIQLDPGHNVPQAVSSPEQPDVPPPNEAPTPHTDDGSPDDGCGNSLRVARSDDLYRSLVTGSDAEQQAAAWWILRTADEQTASIVRRAITKTTEHPHCSHLRQLTQLIEDSAFDDSVRAHAALAVGVIGHNDPCLFPTGACPAPHNPLARFVSQSLIACGLRDPPSQQQHDVPVAVAQACIEALGLAGIQEAVAALRGTRDSEVTNPMLRVSAGRALTRLTNEPSVTDASLNALAAAAGGEL